MSNSIRDIVDDVDDDLFISKKPQNYIFADKKAADIQERTNKSLTNSKAAIMESERVGKHTLEMLSTQREALERAEDGLDTINATTRATQKHLNNMKSWFGGFKSIFGKNSTTTPPAVAANSRSGMTKSATIANMPPDSSSAGPNISTNATNRPSIPQLRGAQNDEPKDQFEEDLSEIGYGLGVLKEMASQLGNEIGDQNNMIDRIGEKSERAGDSIKHQNRQMQQLLKKG